MLRGTFTGSYTQHVTRNTWHAITGKSASARASRKTQRVAQKAPKNVFKLVFLKTTIMFVPVKNELNIFANNFMVLTRLPLPKSKLKVAVSSEERSQLWK